VLKTRYTAPGFWNAGLGLFELAYLLVSEPSEKDYMKACIAQAREHLHLDDNPSLLASQLADNQAHRGDFLFNFMFSFSFFVIYSCTYPSEVLKQLTFVFLCLSHFTMIQVIFLRGTLRLILNRHNLNGWCSQTS